MTIQRKWLSKHFILIFSTRPSEDDKIDQLTGFYWKNSNLFHFQDRHWKSRKCIESHELLCFNWESLDSLHPGKFIYLFSLKIIFPKDLLYLTQIKKANKILWNWEWVLFHASHMYLFFHLIIVGNQCPEIFKFMGSFKNGRAHINFSW